MSRRLGRIPDGALAAAVVLGVFAIQLPFRLHWFNLTDAQLDAVAQSGGVVGVNFHVSFLRADGKVDAETPLDAIVAHIDYMVDRMGIDHVALGSDFDGACMPNELKDVTGLPRLIGCLKGDGYDTNALQKIARENWLRVLRATWKS